MTVLLVARHGNTFAPGDVVTRVGGRTDLPLVASGLEQGARLGAWLRAQALLPDRIVTSRLRRTRQMAEAAMAAMGANPPVEAMDVFDEVDYGPDENRPEADVVARLGAAAIQAWDTDAVVPPGWRVDVDGIRTAWLAFARDCVAAHPRGCVLVITSNGIARFAPVITGDHAAFRAAHGLKLATGAVARFDHDGARWACVAWNLRP
jgi:probable phosphoglycerate mutase